MEIILLENIEKLGFKDEIITVKNGYGRNFLIPTGKAVLATSSAVKVLEEKLRQQAKKEEKTIADANATAETLKGLDVKIKNFKIVHDKSGRKDWELKAELAKINQNKKTTAMDKVEIIFFKDDMKKIKVYADFGTLMNKTNDLSLEGNVKMLIQADVIKKQILNNAVAKNSKLSIR